MRRALRIAGTVIAVLLILLLAAVIYIQFTWDKPSNRPAPELKARHDSASIARGEHIFKDTWQCWGCHAMPATDGNAMPSGGQPFDLSNVGPGFGIFYSRNITPDSSTGIGAWTDGEIVQGIREGVRKDRHTLFPIMPIDWLQGISDADALALVAYLRSIPPVTNRVPEASPSFVAKALLALGVIKTPPVIAMPVGGPPPAPTAGYGRYFATSVAGCAECHTPRNLRSGKFYTDSLFAGSSFAYGDDNGGLFFSFARNITPDETDGIGRWNEADFAMAVTAGLRPDSTVLSPQMPYSHFKFLSADEIRAIYLFLKSLPPIRRTVPAPHYAAEVDRAEGVARGKLLYRARCLSCHGVEGTGARPTNVRLTEVASSMNDADLQEFIAAGQVDLKMPSFRRTLSGQDIQQIVAFVRTWQKK